MPTDPSERVSVQLEEAAREAEKRARSGRMLGYATVAGATENGSSTELQGQRQRIRSACALRGLSLLEIVHEREPKRDRALLRPGLGYALQRICAGEADGLVVADLSRLTRSVTELGRVLEWFSHSEVRLIAAATGLDTAEPEGQFTARVIVDLSRWERQQLVERTKRGMQAARRKGPPSIADYPELRDRILRMRADGMTLQAIADRLNSEGVPTTRGGSKWRPSSVQTAVGYRRPAVAGPLGRPAISEVVDRGTAGSNEPRHRSSNGW